MDETTLSKCRTLNCLHWFQDRVLQPCVLQECTNPTLVSLSVYLVNLETTAQVGYCLIRTFLGEKVHAQL